MVTFIDRHAPLSLARDVMRCVIQQGLHKQVDAHGVRVVGQWVSDGYIYCVIEAPNSAAALQHHADRGLPCGELHQIDGLRAGQPTPAEDVATVRAAISMSWDTPANEQAQHSRFSTPMLAYLAGEGGAP